MEFLGHLTDWRRRTGIDSIRDKHNGAVTTAQFLGGLLQRITNRGIALGLECINKIGKGVPYILLRTTNHVDILAPCFLVLCRLVDRAAIGNEAERNGATELRYKFLRCVLRCVETGLAASVLHIY